jgi:hypothetical protein
LAINLTYEAYSVTLVGPELGDILRFSSGAVNRQLKGGLPKIAKDPSWPVIEIRQYSFKAQRETIIDAFEVLYKAAVGLSVTLVESYGVVLTGYIMNPTIEILTIKDACFYDLEFEYLATIISYPIGNALTDPDYETVTPVEGDDDFISTLENDRYYQLLGEADELQLLGENGASLYGENY